MNGQYTFSSMEFEEWVNPTFDTKKEAIEAGQEIFGGNILIGQLMLYKKGKYKVVFIERVTA